MGTSEWGIGLADAKQYQVLKELIEEHNKSEEAGEELDFHCLLRFEGAIYACIGNSGGRELTSDFIQKHGYDNRFAKIFYPFEKPDGWYECKDSIWKAAHFAEYKEQDDKITQLLTNALNGK